jgi:hypothetical protein
MGHVAYDVLNLTFSLGEKVRLRGNAIGNNQFDYHHRPPRSFPLT